MAYQAVGIIIVAAGQGARFGQQTPKQFLPFLHAPHLVNYQIDIAKKYALGCICVVVPANYKEFWHNIPPNIDIVIGADARQLSVYNGLQHIKAQPNIKYVMVQDSARPFSDAMVVEDMLQAVMHNNYQAAAPFLPIDDALKSKGTLQPVNRDDFLRVQTPQVFTVSALIDAHAQAKNDNLLCTHDDIELYRQYNNKAIYQAKGSIYQHKITCYDDYILMQKILQPNFVSISAQGVDVHAFKKAAKLILGGVEIEHDYGLEGHSDSDVVLHAVTDALLGLSGDGDIGTYFPPSDDTWKNAPSHIFVAKALSLCSDKHITITHIDITIIGEQPKIHPHRDAIKNAISNLIGIEKNHVNIKATTTEKLGFLGRGEGLCAIAHISGTRPL